MDELYKNGLAEVDMILNYADEESINKIPKSLLKFIEENKSNYTPKIDPNKNLNEQDLLYETKVILSVLYRDYWASEDERKQLLKSEKQELIKIENRKQEKYNYNNLFKKNKNERKEDLQEIKSLVVRENLLKKILNKIKRIFKSGVN